MLYIFSPSQVKIETVVEQIYNFQKLILLPELDSVLRCHNGKTKLSLCSILLNQINNIKLYDSFMNEFEAIINEINSSIISNNKKYILIRQIDQEVSSS